MKRRNTILASLIIAAVIGLMAGCASTPAGPAYPFDGTVWTKSEEAELSFSKDEGEVTIDGTKVAWERKFEGTSNSVTLNSDGTLTISSGQNGWAHYVGTWTKKSGDAAGGLAGTVWTRTETQVLEFADGMVTIKNGEAFILPAKKYRATDKQLTVNLDNGASRVDYSVDGTALTISNASEQAWGFRRIAGTWTKQ